MIHYESFNLTKIREDETIASMHFEINWCICFWQKRPYKIWSKCPFHVCNWPTRHPFMRQNTKSDLN